MPASSVALVYSVATGRLRWFVVPDSDSALSKIKPKIGEATLTVTRAQYLAAGSGPSGLQALVNAHTGLTPTNDRYAIVDTGGNVPYAVFADPLIDQTPSVYHSFVAHPTASPGDFYLGGVVIQKTLLVEQILKTRERSPAFRR